MESSYRPSFALLSFLSRFLLAGTVACAAFASGCGGETEGTLDAAQPAALCLPSGAQQLVFSSPGFGVVDLVSNGRTLFVGGVRGPHPKQAHELWLVPLADPGSADQVPDAHFSVGSATLGPSGAVVYLSAEIDGLASRPNGVFLHDETGRTRPIVAPGTDMLLPELVADENGVSFATFRPGEPIELRRWDAATDETRALGDIHMSTGFVGDGAEMFAIDQEGFERRLVAYPTSGGAPRVVTTMPATSPPPRLVAVGGHALYIERSPRGPLSIMSKTDGTSLGAVPDVSLPWHHVASDGSHLYWVDQGPTTTGSLRRMSLATHEVEVVTESDQLTMAVGVDACNVYFALGTNVWARGK